MNPNRAIKDHVTISKRDATTEAARIQLLSQSDDGTDADAKAGGEGGAGALVVALLHAVAPLA